MENFVLVEVESLNNPTPIKVIRSYLSKPRADQDCALLEEVNQHTSYVVQTVEHIDD